MIGMLECGRTQGFIILAFNSKELKWQGVKSKERT